MNYWNGKADWKAVCRERLARKKLKSEREIASLKAKIAVKNAKIADLDRELVMALELT